MLRKRVFFRRALMAQVAQNIATIEDDGEDGTAPAAAAAGSGAADRYLGVLMQRLQALHGSAMGEVAAAGEAMANAVLSNKEGGGKLYPWSGRAEFFSVFNLPAPSHTH
jgi:hypothetical protein